MSLGQDHNRISTISGLSKSANIVAQFLRALAELFGAETDAERQARLETALRRRQREQSETPEQAIQDRYPDAWYRRHEIEQRARHHGVDFSRFLSDAHKLAILDFLDDPDAPTPLDWGHMTQFRGCGPDGVPTGSRTHPVNRAIYTWNARDLANRTPTGVAGEDAAVARLQQLYPIERAGWTAAQWAEYEGMSTAPHRRTVSDLVTAGRPRSNHVPDVL